MAPAAMRLVAQVDSERTSADEVELVRLGSEPLQVRLRSLCCPPGDATPLVYSPAFGSAVSQDSKAPNVASSDLLALPVDRAHGEKEDGVPKPLSDGMLDSSLNLPDMENRAGEDAFFTPPSQTEASRPRTPEITSFAGDEPKNRTVPDQGPMVSTASHSGSGLVSASDVPEVLGLLVRNGDEIVSSIPASTENPSTDRTSPARAPSSGMSLDSSRPASAAGPALSLTISRVASPAPAQTFELTEADKADLGDHALLVQLLGQQRSDGKAQSKCSFVSAWLRQQGPSWLTKRWKLREYLADAAQRGLVVLDYPPIHPDGSVCLRDDWENALLPLRRFRPLQALCAGRERVNQSFVATNVRALHPGLIPSGAGKVRAYMDDAVAAGVVVYLDEQREWFRLVA
jgi:hypothetical protein